ncbi:MAG TPA: hypothetical protein VG602_01350 [Actinomycetota bacterium]|nr:hypothetical protein [Actinomycetota bacterium]
MHRALKLVLASSVAVMLPVSVAVAANGDCRQIRGAATPDDPSDDVSVCRQDAWFHTTDLKTKVGNLAGFGAGIFPTWTNTKPGGTGSEAGAGVYATNSTFHQLVAPQDPRGSAVFEGKYTGTLDNIAVTLYAFVPPIFTRDLNLELTIDGVQVFAGNAVVKGADGGSGTQKLTFAFTNIYEALDGAAKAGDASTEHTIKVAANGRYIVNDPAVFVYDAPQWPSGLIFNVEPEGLADYAVIDVFGVE